MPGPNAGGGGPAAAFQAQYGAIPGTVKMSYKGKDKFGNSIYTFTYKTMGGGGKGGRLGTITNTRTLAVNRKGGGWNFASPGSPGANPNKIAGADEVDFSGGTKRTELVDRAVAKLGDLVSRGLLTSEQAKTYNFSTWSDTALRMWISRAGTGNRPGASVIERTPAEAGAEGLLGDVFTDSFGGGGGGFGGGGGGGGGSLEPGIIYKGPDKRVVEDYVKGTLTSLLGFAPEHLIGPGVEQYLADHRAMFDREIAAEIGAAQGVNADIEEIDPQMSVLEYIRSTNEYQTIHKLRPDGEDEREWVARRRQAGEQGGLQTDLDQFAVNMATVGGDLEDTQRAGAMQQFQKAGQMPTILDNQFRQIAQAMASRAGGR